MSTPQPPYGYQQPVITEQARRKGNWMFRIAVALLVLAVPLGLWSYLHSPRIAVPGDCTTGGTPPKLTACSSATAEYRVTQRANNDTLLSYSCPKGTTRTYRGKYRKHFRSYRYVLCLAPVAKH
ncbi:hypothetical protein AB0K51_17605 [Kitasatospora sp. NPDC049285]|uniref:LppU/SCO3897 family protein n=1 Tax=Kitasatospora sp. NPDC049285 TaxID=3157096 RepID=UPI00344A5E5D